MTGLLLAFALGTMLVFAPTIATRTIIRDYLLRRFLAKHHGTVTVKELRFGWITPLAIDGLDLRDAGNKPVLSIRSVRGNRTILGLVSNSRDLGSITLLEPTLHALLRPSGSNVEDLIASCVPATSKQQDSGTTASIIVRDGSLLAAHEQTAAVWNATDVELTLNLKGSAQSCDVRVTGTMSNGDFTLDATDLPLNLQAGPMQNPALLSVRADALGLAPLQYVAERFGYEIALAGTAGIAAEAHWHPATTQNHHQPNWQLSASVEIARLQCVAPELLEDDIDVAKLNLRSRVSFQGGRLHLQTLNLVTDVATAEVEASFGTNQHSHHGFMGRLTSCEQLKGKGVLDVAAICQVLPKTLRLREDLSVHSGRVEWVVNGGPRPNTPNPVTSGEWKRYQGWLRTRDWAMSQGGRSLAVDFPLNVSFDVHYGNDLVIQELAVNSGNLQFSAAGRRNEGRLHCKANLKEFFAQLQQIVKLDEYEVSGEVGAEVRWNETETAKLSCQANAHLTQFQFRRPGQPLWRESDTMMRCQFDCDVANGLAIAAANATLTTGADSLAVYLNDPVAEVNSNSIWPLRCELTGYLATWLSRIEAASGVPMPRAQGKMDGVVDMSVSPGETDINSLKLNIRDVRGQVGSTVLNESLVRMTASGSIDHRTLASSLADLEFTSGSLALAGRNLHIGPPSHPSASGDIAFRASLPRIVELTGSPTLARSLSASSVATGNVNFRKIDGGIAFSLSTDVELPAKRERVEGAFRNASYAERRKGGSPFPKVELRLNGAYALAEDRLVLHDANLAANGIQLATRGSANDLMGLPNIDLSGEIEYDLQRLLGLTSPWAPQLQLTGKHRQPIVVRGPLLTSTKPSVSPFQNRVSPNLLAKLAFAWDEGNIYEIPLGRGTIHAELSNGAVSLQPSELQLGGGHFLGKPVLYLNSPHLLLRLQPGVVAKEVQITPHMCSTWLRFVAPLIADATTAAGTYSLSTSKCDVPLIDIGAGQIAGELAIHHSTIGPGALANQLSGVAQQVKQLIGKGSGSILDSSSAWVTLPPQRVQFQLVDRRVYHEGFQMMLDDIPIRTRGSVGLDESLAIVAEVPVQPEWIQSEPALSGLQGQTISLPMAGSLSQPRLDDRALLQLSSQLVRKAAEGYLQKQLSGELQKQLHKLFN